MPEELLKSLLGSWEGTCRTWFEPGELADESRISGSIRPMLGGKYVRHEYESTMQGRPRHGEETIALNPVTKRFQLSWVDDFHTGSAILFSEGDATERGFVVSGSYAISLTDPPWGWKTVFEIVDADHITITAFNLMPGEPEAKAVETQYVRVGA